MKKAVISGTVLLLLFALTSCGFITELLGPLNGDWTYELPKGFEIWRLNFLDKALIGTDEYGTNYKASGEGRYIREFCYNQNNICFEYIVLTEEDIYDEQTGKIRLNEEDLYTDTFKCRWCVYDFDRKAELADYETLEELEADKGKYGYECFEWISTKNKPANAYY